MKKNAPDRTPKLLLALALLAVLAALVLRGFLARRTKPAEMLPEPAREQGAPAAPRKAARRVFRAAGAPFAKARDGAAQQGCAPAAFLRCHEGDVWSEDSCGRLEDKVEECDLQLCREAACEEPDSEPCQEPAEGRCDGDVIRICYAGRAESIDCAARGLRCLAGEEGAECGPRLAPEERCSGPVRCEGDVLVTCVAEQRQRSDCRALGGVCAASPGGGSPRCLARARTLPLAPDCGPCGCPPSSSGERACDGRDEDGDRQLDEGLSCGPVPIVAFVIGDDAGESSFARAELEQEIARANALLASAPDEPELSFNLADVVVLRAASLLDLSEREFTELAFDARVHPARTAFYVPVVFTDRLLADGEVPRLGVSTLPNGYCGGLQRGRSPPVGLVAIAKARAPTTLLHELGHFFGLCHTHDLTFGLQTVSDDPRRAGALLCGEPCRHEGDGICDTPLDPGPESCRFDAACRTLCQRGEVPDVVNLMSYYTPCRERFSPEQRRTIEHTLALRRAWHACLSAPCTCELGADECPAGMGCRPGAELADKGRCALAGSRPPAAPCETHGECAGGALCVGEERSGKSRCARACKGGAAVGCTCVETNLGVGLCREDLGGERLRLGP